MARIKCPNCNIDIRDDLTTCPYCGSQSVKNSNVINTSVNPNWTDSWKTKLLLVRILSIVIFVGLNVLSVVLVKTYFTSTIKSLTGVLFFLSLIALYIFIMSVLRYQVSIRVYDEYNVLVYQGLFGYLVIEDKVVAKKFMGLLPVVNKDTILDPSTVCLFLNLDTPEIDEVSAKSLKDSKDLLGRLPNNKKVLAHYDGKKFVLMNQVSND
ncbi:MAG: hypothetical protein J6T15_05905 [Bacilli bacterium]|nr:hypothetical protein [Bacilli bacterium]